MDPVATTRAPARRTTRAPLAAAALVAGLAVVVSTTPVLAGPSPTTKPERCDEQAGTRPKRCVGPVLDESGGGGDTLTIVVSVIVGLAVATVAFVLLRRQLS